MKHLNSAEILEAVNSKKMPGHLCDSCADRIALLKEFQSAVSGSAILMGKKKKDCLSQEDIANIIDNEETKSVSEKQLHIQNCCYCFESAAYYHAKSTAMKTDELPSAPEKYLKTAINLTLPMIAPTSENKTVWDIIRNSFRTAPLPAFATAVILFLFIFIERDAIHVSEITGGSQYSIFANLANKQPLFYLGKSGEKIGSRPAEMKVEAGRQTIKFLWKDVKEADRYNFVLQNISGIAPQTVMRIETKKNSVTIDSKEFAEDGKYLWILAGGLPEKRYFVGKLKFRVTE